MTKVWILTLAGAFALAGSAGAQEKPRVFVQGKGSQDVSTSGGAVGGKHWGSWGSKSAIDSHDESMEVTKDLQKNCTSVTVTLNQSNADYTVMLNRESKHNRGLLRTNSQLEVANKVGDVLGTNATHTVGNAAKDACQMIMSDWQAHGRLNGQEAQAPASAPTAPTAAVSSATPAELPSGARLQPVAATSSGTMQAHPAADPVVTGVTISNGTEPVGEAARRQKQHKACLELAKDNPSIVCK